MASDVYRKGRLGSKVLDDVVGYISSYDDDREIFDDIARINMAHVVMLHASGYIDGKDAASILSALSRLSVNALGEMPKMEDAHMALEALVIGSAGRAGENVNLGKSRNDQVAAAIRMHLRSYIVDLVGSGASLAGSLIRRARDLGDAVMPGFTHLQPAQPLTMGYLMAAHAEELIRDLHRLLEAYNRVNLSPLGAAAMSGSTVRVSRYHMARLLGFKDVLDNAVDAVSARDFAVESLAAMVTISLEASRLAEHIVLWSSPEFGYVEVPDEYASTSSIMPNKKNPVVAELARAKAASPLSSLVAVSAILKSLPYSYNLDLQDATPYIWRAARDTISTLNMLAGIVDGLSVNRDRMLEDARRGMTTASDLAEFLAVKYRVPFRTAHKIVGAISRLAASDSSGGSWGPELKGALEAAAAEEGYQISVDRDELAEVMDPTRAVERRSHVRMSGGGYVAMLDELDAKVRRISSWRDVVIEELKRSQELLEERVKALIGGVRDAD